VGKYDSIIKVIFAENFAEGKTSIKFKRELLQQKADELKIGVPKNLGDIIYSYKYRNSMPDEIAKTAPEGYYWRIRNVGRAQYEFVMEEGMKFIEPATMLSTTKIPDATPSIVKKYSVSDEQALLAVVRYNRLIDIFLGVTCYSLQNHLRTTVQGIGQIETDELYIGIDKKGRQYIMPVQAKGGTDKLSITQIEQDIMLCKEKYPELICRAIACQFISANNVAMFEFTVEDGKVLKEDEKHYMMVDANEITDDELNRYNMHTKDV